jgi:hypothetical protein
MRTTGRTTGRATGSTPRPRAVPRSHAAAEAGVGLLLVLAVVLGACSGGGDDSSGGNGDGGNPADGATDAPAAIETTATLGKVTGKLPKAKRSKARQQVAHAVDEWFDAAYVAGDYPRDDFSTSWPGFTTGAKADAQVDKGLMSNQDIGSDISSVEAMARKVTVDVLAVKGHAQGATARFVLKFRTDGDVRRKLEVRGRLFLTPGPDGWQIFGYDVTKGRAA